MRLDPTELTGLNLLEKLLAQEKAKPDSSQWLLDVPHHYPPEKARLRQLAVLTTVFVPKLANLSLSNQLEAIRSGDFIRFRNVDLYRPLFADMKARYLQESRSHTIGRPGLDRQGLDNWGLESGYKRLLRFKRLIESVKAFNSGVLEADFQMMHSVVLTRSVADAIDLSEIDTFLWTLIDPERRTFAKADLVSTYGYPSEDLFDLELDWL